MDGTKAKDIALGNASGAPADLRVPLKQRMPPFPAEWKDVTQPMPKTKIFTKKEVVDALQATPPSNVKVDFKQFAQLNCDSTLQNTGLDGGMSHEWSDVLSKYLSDPSQWDPNVSREGLDRSKKLVAELSNSRLEITRSPAEVKDIVAEYQRAIDKLDVNEFLAIPGGYRNDSGGHAVTYVIERRSASGFAFKVVNTGDGVNFHPSIDVGSKTKYNSVMTYTSIDRDELTETFLYSLLFTFSSCKKSTMSDDMIYQLIETNLRKATLKTDFELTDFITAQRSGTCAVKAQLALIRTLIGEKSYKKLIYYISIDSVRSVLDNSFDHAINGISQVAHTNRTIVKSAAENLMHMATKRSQISQLEEGKHREGILLAAALLEKVECAENLAIQQFQQEVLEQQPIDQATVATRRTHAPGAGVSYPRPIPVIVVVPKFERFTKASEDLVRKRAFRSLQDRLAGQADNNSGKRAQIEAFVAALPISAVDNSFWDVSGRNAEKLMEDLLQVMESYIPLLSQDGVRVPGQKNTIYALFCSMHSLCRIVDRRMAPHFGTGDLLNEATANHLFLSPTEFARHREILDYQNQHMQAKFERSWDYDYVTFNPANLKGLQKYFYESHYTVGDNQEKAVARSISDGLGYNPARRKGEGGYDFARTFQHFIEKRNSDPIDCLTFRRMQKASLLLTSIENKMLQPRSYSFMNDMGSPRVSVTLNPENTSTRVARVTMVDHGKELSHRVDPDHLIRHVEVLSDDREAIRNAPTREKFIQILRRHAIADHVLSPIDLIAFAKQFFSEFKDCKTRALFEHQLFKAPQGKMGTEIGKELLKDHFLKEVMKFLESEKLSSSRDLKDENIDLSLFLIRVATQLLTHVPKGEYTEYTDFLKSYISEFLEEIPIKTLSEDGQANVLLHGALYQSILLERDEHDPMKVIASWIRLKHNTLKDESLRRELGYLTLVIEERIIPKLPYLVSDDQAWKSALSEVLFSGPCAQADLQGYTLTFRNVEGKRAKICLLSGDQHTYGSDTKTPFPLNQLYNNPCFSEVIDKDAEGYSCTFGTSYLSINTKQGEYRVSYMPTVYERPFLIEKKITEGAEGAESKWGRQLTRLEAYQLYHVKIDDTRVECDIPYALIESCDIWNTETSLIFTDRVSGKPLYNDTRGQPLRSVAGAKVYCCKDDNVVRSIESPALTHIEEDPEGNCKLKFSRFESLEFIREAGKEDWRLVHDASYKLKFNTTRDLGYFEHYMILESVTGQTVALIPDLSFTKDQDNSRMFFDLHRLGEYDIYDSPEPPNRLELEDMLYHTIPVIDGKLSPATHTQSVTCAYLSLGMREYEEARKYLEKVSITDVGSSEECSKAILQFAELGLSGINSPDGIALAMKSYYLLARSGKKDAQECIGIYLNYLDQLGNISTQFRLSQEEEKWLLKNSNSLLNARIMNRARTLNNQVLDLSELMFSFKQTLSPIEVVPCHSFQAPPAGVNTRAHVVNNFALGGFVDLLARNFDSNMPALFNTCIKAKKFPDQEYKLESLINTAIMLNPHIRSQAAFLLAILKSKSQKEYVEPKSSQYSTPYPDMYDWVNDVEEDHAIRLGDKISLNMNQHLESHGRVKKTAGVTHVMTPLKAPVKVRVELSDRLVVDNGLDMSSTFTDLLFAKKGELKGVCTQGVKYPKEVDHFADLAVLDSQEDASKWTGAENVAKEEFLAGYKDTLVKRGDRKVPSMSLDNIKLQIQDIEAGKAGREAEVKQLERDLLLLANFCPDAAKVQNDTDKLGGIKKDVTVTDLLYLFFFAQKDGYNKVNQYLDADQIEVLFNLSALYFRASVEERQLNRMGSIYEKVAKGLEAKAMQHTSEAFAEDVSLDPKFTELLYQLLEVSGQDSDYDLVAHPERVVFEYAMEIMLRVDPDQVSTLQFLIDAVERGQNPTIQFRMGGGKTSVFMVYLLALIASKEGNIPILMTPLFQLEAVESMLRENLKKTFNVDLRTLKLERVDLDLPHLEELNQVLDEIQSGPSFLSPKVLMVCPESIQSIELEYYIRMKDLMGVDDFYDYSEEDFKKLKLLRTILTKIQDHGVVLADETHILLNVNQELNFPLGDPEPVEEDVIKLLIEIGKILQKDEIKTALHLDTNTQSKHFKLQTYKDDILPKIVNELKNYQGLLLDDAKQKEVLPRYIMGEINPELELELDKDVPAIPDGQQDDFDFLLYLRGLAKSPVLEDQQAAAMIALAKNVLSSLLPHLLAKKTANFNFGRARDPKRPGETVPYVTADTPSTNKFGNEIEELVQGCLTTVIYGIEECQVRGMFEKFQQEAHFCTNDLKMAYEDTEVVKSCRERFEIAPDELEENIEAVMARIKGSSDLTFYVQKWTFDEFLEKYKLRLNSNAMSIVTLFKQFIAMSGTPPVGLFHHSLQDPRPDDHPEKSVRMDKTVNSDVMHAWTSKAKPIEIVESGDADREIVNPEEILERICADRSITGLLDLGGITKDMGNDQVAKYILERLPETMKGVVYFTSFEGSKTSDFPAVLLRGEDEPKRLMSLEKKELMDKYQLEPGNFFLSLDKRHCVGIDAPALDDATFGVTWEIGLTMSDASQGLARLRKLLNGQNAKAFIAKTEIGLFPNEQVVPADEVDMREVRFEELENDMQYKVLIKQALKMQGREDATMKLKSSRKMLTNAIVVALRHHMLKADLENTDDLPNLKNLIECFHDYIFIHENEDLFDLYGGLEKEMPTLETLGKEQKLLFKRLEKDQQSGNIPLEVLETVRKEHEKIMQLAEDSCREYIQTTPKPISNLGDMGGSGGQEMQTEVQAERQVEVIQELNEEIDEEINSMQGPYTLIDKAPPGFNPGDFLNEHQKEVVLPDDQTSVAMESVFSQDHSPMRYKNPYGKVLSKNLRMTKAFLHPYSRNVALFDRRTPPIQYMLLMKDPDSMQCKGVIVSRDEARDLKKYVNEKEVENVWLLLPNGELHAGNAETIPEDSEEADFLMLEFNILSGKLNYCFKNLSVYLNWLNSGDEFDENERSIKIRLVDLIYHKFRSLHTQHHRLLTVRKEVEKRVYKDDPTELIEQAKGVLPSEIQTWGNGNTRVVPYLSSADQVGALPDSLIDYLQPSQMKFITDEKFKLVTRARCIKGIPKSVLTRVPFEDIPEGMFKHFTNDQLGYFTNRAVLDKVTKQKWKYLNVEVFDDLTLDKDWESLTDLQIAHLSEESLLPALESGFSEKSCRVAQFKDSKAVLYLFDKKRKCFPDSLYSELKEPLVVLQILEDSNLKKCNEALFSAALDLEVCRDRFKKVRDTEIIEDLWDLGYEDLSDDQIGLIENGDMIADIRPDKLHLVGMDFGKYIPHEHLTVDMVKKYGVKLSVDDQVKEVSDELLKTYVENIGVNDRPFTIGDLSDSDFLGRLVKAGYAPKLKSHDIPTLKGDDVFACLTDVQLFALSNVQAKSIKDKALLNRLTGRALSEIHADVVYLLNPDKISELSVDFVATHANNLTEAQVKVLSGSQMDSYIKSSDNPLKYFPQCVDQAILNIVKEAGKFELLTDAQKTIVDPDWDAIVEPGPGTGSPGMSFGGGHRDPGFGSANGGPARAAKIPDSSRKKGRGARGQIGAELDALEKLKAKRLARKNSDAGHVEDFPGGDGVDLDGGSGRGSSASVRPPIGGGQPPAPGISGKDSRPPQPSAKDPQPQRPITASTGGGRPRGPQVPVQQPGKGYQVSERQRGFMMKAIGLKGKSESDIKEFMKSEKEHRQIFLKVNDPESLSCIIGAGFMGLSNAQITRLPRDTDLLKLPLYLLAHASVDQVKKIKVPELVKRLGPDQVSNVDPKLVKYIAKDSVTGIENKKLFKALSLNQLRLAKSSQMPLGTVLQLLTYSVITLANAFFSLIIFPIVETLYYTTHVCSFHLFDPAHKYVRGSIGRELSFSWYCFHNTVLFGMYNSKQNKLGNRATA